jgi:hypothetical protein
MGKMIFYTSEASIKGMPPNQKVNKAEYLVFLSINIG